MIGPRHGIFATVVPEPEFGLWRLTYRRNVDNEIVRQFWVRNEPSADEVDAGFDELKLQQWDRNVSEARRMFEDTI